MSSLSSSLSSSLTSWFDANKRTDLPWREPCENAELRGYRVLVSEIMSQQTRIATVLPYYKRWMERWPTLASLTAATDEQVAEQWAGLGYYRRGRNLRAAAVHVMEKLDGKLPRTAQALLALPGVGAYTAGAVASIAFGERTPAVDGNVVRVLSRVHAVDDDGSKAAGQARYRTLATQLLAEAPTTPPGAINEALMEFGALVCTPKAPQCAACSLAAQCAARAADRVASLPPKKTKKRPRDESVAVLVLRDAAQRVLMTRRDADASQLSGLLELPTAPVAAADDDDARRRALREHASLAADVALDYVGVVQHAFSHINWSMHVYRATVAAAAAAAAARGEWFAALPTATSAGNVKCFALVAAADGGARR